MNSATWAQVRARRLVRSSLVERAGADRLVDTARDLGGVHAQVQTSAELQLGARVEGITQTDVREALWARRSLVKAWTLRGTLHLHPAGELALWFAARRAVAGMSADDHAEMEAWQDPAGVLHPPLGSDDVRAIHAAVWDALDGRCLLREELAEEVVQRVGPRARHRLLSGFAFFLGDLCQGPPRGTRVTFVRPDQWVEGWREVDAQEALREVCRRYLHTYGPARPADFREWFAARAFTAARARALFDALGEELEAIDVEGRRAYVLAGDTAFPELPGSLRLLPEYDVYIMGSREREQLIPEAVRRQVAAHGRGRYEGPAGVRFLVVDGVAAGLWERRKRGRRIELRVAPARTLTRVERAQLAGEAERVGAFVGLEPRLTVD
ncbi:MAG TPA: winged helix DNA-binding domain-containing protein [Thermomicrobiaceae bacterium]|nr:winged helix DNA-binding domain-containing protein [Thermomicrobiaceae bacterium]